MHFSIRNGDRLDKRGHPVRGDLGVVQDDFSRHMDLLLRFPSTCKGGRKQASGPCSLLVSYPRSSGNGIFGELWGWSAVYHRVHVLASDPIGSVMVIHNVH